MDAADKNPHIVLIAVNAAYGIVLYTGVGKIGLRDEQTPRERPEAIFLINPYCLDL